jgi:hypothetical protein
MGTPFNSAVVLIGDQPNQYSIERVTVDPRAGLARALGSRVSYIPGTSINPGAISLLKYAPWNTAWRPDGVGPLYPKTATEFLRATQITPSALYINDQMLGDAYDASGNGNTLAANVANLVYQQTLESKNGIYLPAAAGGKLSGAVNDPGAGSFIWGAVTAMISFGGFVISTNLIGRSEAATSKGFVFYVPSATGVLNYWLKDNAGNNIFGPWGPNMTTTPIVPYLVVGQVDRAAGRFRALCARDGAVVNTLDVAAVPATFTAAGQEFGQGAIPGWSAGAWDGYSFFASGVQCEGTDVLHNIAVGLGQVI